MEGTGQSATLTLNTDHKVSDIHAFILSAIKFNGEGYRIFVGGNNKMMSRPLDSDPGMTIQEAQLEGA